MNIEVNCAWNRAGYCVMHKADCNCCGDCTACSDRVAKARHISMVSHPFKREFNMLSAKGRMQRRTEGVDGGVVYSQCTRKRRYAAWSRANEVLRCRMRHGADQLRVYHCRFCDGYHLTSKCRHDQDVVKKVA